MRIEQFFDGKVTNDELRRCYPSAMKSGAGYDAPTARSSLIARGMLLSNFVRYAYRPFDIRWLYWEPETRLLDRSRPEYQKHIFEGNFWIEAREKQTKEDFSRGAVVSVLADNFGNGLSTFFPVYLRSDHDHQLDLSGAVERRPNVSRSVAEKLRKAGLSIEELFHHTARRFQKGKAVEILLDRLMHACCHPPVSTLLKSIDSNARVWNPVRYTAGPTNTS